MNMIYIEHHGNIAVMKLNRSTTNPLNLELIKELSESIRKMKNDSNVHGAVLASANEKFFSIGWDIPHLINLDKKDFKVFFQTFNRTCIDLYTLPKPTVAAVTGHAVAGGCILALCCDYRFIAEGRKLMGLNEIKLGVPIPYPADCILRYMVDIGIARETVDMGDFYNSEQLFQMGLVDQVLPLDQVVPTAIDRASLLGAMPQKAFAAIKRNRVEPVENQILQNLKEKEESFMECWFSDEARERLKKAMEKF